jgi:hypothetical protein
VQFRFFSARCIARVHEWIFLQLEERSAPMLEGRRGVDFVSSLAYHRSIFPVIFFFFFLRFAAYSLGSPIPTARRRSSQPPPPPPLLVRRPREAGLILPAARGFRRRLLPLPHQVSPLVSPGAGQ